MKTLSTRRPVCLRRIFTHFHMRQSLLESASTPLLYAVSGSSGFRDEFLTFGLRGGVVVILAAPAFLGGIHRGKERDQ